MFEVSFRKRLHEADMVRTVIAISEYFFFIFPLQSLLGSPTARDTGAEVGVDSAWEQEKLEARKMLENAARRPCGRQSPASSARCVRCGFV